jgi:hypothetical protein
LEVGNEADAVASRPQAEWSHKANSHRYRPDCSRHAVIRRVKRLQTKQIDPICVDFNVNEQDVLRIPLLDK